MTNINMGVNNVLIAGGVYDFEEAWGIFGIRQKLCL
jgi:hypothetical protein